MKAIADIIDTINRIIGKAVAWFALLMVLVQFGVVVARYVFGVGNLWAQESIIYMHAFLFMLAAAYTLSDDGHVRVDIFYRSASMRYRMLVDMLGAIVLLIPVSLTITYVSWGYVSSSWAVLESSMESSGIPAVFILKTPIPVFGIMMTAQGVVMILRSILALTGQWTPPAAEHPAP